MPTADTLSSLYIFLRPPVDAEVYAEVCGPVRHIVAPRGVRYKPLGRGAAFVASFFNSQSDHENARHNRLATCHIVSWNATQTRSETHEIVCLRPRGQNSEISSHLKSTVSKGLRRRSRPFEREDKLLKALSHCVPSLCPSKDGQASKHRIPLAAYLSLQGLRCPF